MTVVSVEKKKKHLTLVSFDDGSELLLDNDVCDIHCIREDDIISAEKAEELKYESDYLRAKSRALWYLDRAAHTEKGLYDKLIKAGFDKKASAAVMARLSELGLINDVRFAEIFAERCSESNISSREAVYKMITKGVPRDIAKAAVDALDTDEETQIYALLEKKYRSKLSSENGTQKVYAALVRKGFSFGAVRNVLKKYSEELEYSEE